ncbi:MAG: hypothetical protein OXI96_08255 [Acidimicrobiaceae bacterium]|nr:hypothetical protein [Acidimicrobiaceae bacterium]
MSNRASVPAGRLLYTLREPPCSGTGIEWSRIDLDNAINDRVFPVLFDEEGMLNSQRILTDVAETEFMRDNLARVLSFPVRIEKWRMGEAIAEAYL